MIFVLLFLSIVTFFLMKLAPGDPVRTLLKADEVVITKEQEQALRSELLLDQPVLQYLQWLKGIFQLDLGESYSMNAPVLDLLLGRLPNTLLLTIGGLLVMVLIAGILGVASAYFYNSALDHVCRTLILIGASMPSFWLGLLCIQWFSLQLGWFPSSGSHSIKHLILPSITLGIGMSAVYARLLQASLLEEYQQPYVQNAKAKGLTKWTMLTKHSMKSALIPILSMFGLSMGSLLGGTVVIESVFAWPGIGSMVIEAILKRDYPVIQGYILVTGLFVLVINFLVDVAIGILDPRIRMGEKI